jgi:hypothetical protein
LMCCCSYISMIGLETTERLRHKPEGILYENVQRFGCLAVGDVIR